MARALRDANYVPTLIGVSSDDLETIVLGAIDPATNRLLVNVAGTVTTSAPTQPTTLLAFITDIPNAGTRVQLASNTIENGVIIQAPSTNTGVIYVGGSAVSSTVYGAELQPGQSVGLSISNTNKVYVDTATNGNDVAVFGA